MVSRGFLWSSRNWWSVWRRSIRTFIDAMSSTSSTPFLAKSPARWRGERVELRGFGVFSTKLRLARTGLNPLTGDKVPVAEKLAPFFKTGKEMRERLNAKPL